MISYAQNFEDVLLERCFKEVTQGIYIDVGACHPIRDSVTYWFYRRGWRGMNVDAAASSFRMLSRYRPRDINVNAFVAERDKEIEFFDCGLAGLSSSDPRLAEHARSRGFPMTRVLVRTTTLNALFSKHDVDQIDFLKIDAEGSEQNVLAGLNLNRWRPKLILTEAVDPVTGSYSNQASVDMLRNSGYTRCYFDGLNDYFLDVDSGHLAQHFQLPVNVFDGVQKWSDRAADVWTGSLEAIAWRRIFDLRLKKRWSELTVDDEIERECRELEAGPVFRKPNEADVKHLYIELLGRVPELEEIRQWLDTSETSQFTTRDLVRGIVQSDEYCRKSLEWGAL